MFHNLYINKLKSVRKYPPRQGGISHHKLINYTCKIEQPTQSIALYIYSIWFGY